MYYLLNYTWGLLTTLLGWIVYLILLPFSSSHGKIGKAHYLEIGNKDWGGFSLGVCCFVCDSEDIYIKTHEYGHTIQNGRFGLFMPFLIIIPSVIRYWYQTAREKKGLRNEPYEAIWFERQATELGEANYRG